ncbi:MAG: histidine kinase [Taibaiella sp.]|nr:histidine kinase [Taibaiella sp.]
MNKKWLILFFFMVCAHFSRAQHPFYYTITDDNGLPSNEVYDIEQDSFGYVWIGCDAGLYRYDGFRFARYSNRGQNAVAISALRFSGSSLYCQNFFGQVFRLSDDSLHIEADVKERVMGHPEYAVAADGRLWVTLPGGVYSYSRGRESDRLSVADSVVHEIEMLGGKELYYITGSGVLWHDRKPGFSSPERITLPDHLLENTTTYSLRAFGKRLLLTAYNPKSNLHTIAVLSDGNLTMVRKFRSDTFAERLYNFVLVDGGFWVCTSDGAYLLDNSGEIRAHHFPGEKISDMLMDREGEYWFSSLQNGLFVVPHPRLMLLNSTNSTLADDNVTAVQPFGESSLLVGTYGGDVYVFDYLHNGLEKLPRSPDMVYRNVTRIIPRDDGKIIVARGGLSSIDPKSRRERYFAATYIRDIAEAGDSLYFVSTQAINALSVRSVTHDGSIVKQDVLVKRSGKKVCYEAATGTLWFSLNTGLAYRRGAEFQPYLLDNKPLFASALYADTGGLWVGTVSDGVYNIRSGKVQLHLDEATGLLGNNIKCFASRGDTLYIATDVCINVRYPDGALSYIRHANGINAKEINAMCVAGPLLAVATLRGLFYVPVGTKFTNRSAPNIKLRSVVVNGVEVRGANVNLPYDNRDIVVNFSSVAMRSRGRFNYMYRITGFEDEWKALDGSTGRLLINHLPAGNFGFQVKAVNEDGVESGIAALKFHIRPPFWQTPAFYILLALTTALLVAILFLIRIRSIQRRASIREQITTSQLTALKAQMNPHFMYNTLNSIQDLVLQKDIKNTNYYLSRYSSLMRKILDSSGSSEIELAEEVEMLQLYLELEQLRFGGDFKFTIDCAPGIDKNGVEIPSMLIQPFVENALKHGLLHRRGEKRLRIAFSRSGTGILCTIADNGVGRARAAEIKARSAASHKSFATQATLKRLELINAGRSEKVTLEIRDLQDEHGALGTEVLIYFPLHSRS